MKNTHYPSALILLLLFAVGCGGNVAVTGKVTFQDGTPLESGTVFFESTELSARGYILSGGVYSLETGEQKGIPPGTYRVSIGGYEPTVVPAPIGPDGLPAGMARIVPAVIPIADKFLSAETSGLVCEVKRRTKFDITVEPPVR